jgi:hypothetical protein
MCLKLDERMNVTTDEPEIQTYPETVACKIYA